MTSPKTKNRFLRHWPVLLGITLTAIPMVALAADTPKAITDAFAFFSIILTGMQAVLWPILLMMGGLLNNDLLFSGGMQTILLNIWTAVRDFVNVLFVLGLLAIAIVNILGIPGDEFAIKTALPKIAIALIAVNFSFLACKVILDVVNVTTTAIYAVPMASDSLAKYQPGSPDLKALSDKFCNKIMSIPNTSKNEDLNAYCETPVKDPKTGIATSKLKEAGIAFFQKFNASNVALVMAMELMSITNIDTVDPSIIKGTKDLAVQTIFSIIFLVIYATSFIALFITLLVRVVVLWITIATMPISFIGMAFKKVHDKLADNDPWKLFLSHALIPIPVALVLTIGMIMISQLKQISPGVQYSTDPHSLKALTAGASTLQDLIAGFATAAFIWTAAFMAMKGTKADPFISKIQTSVQGFGMAIAKAPLYIPFIPTSKGKVGLAALGGLGAATQSLESSYTKMRGDWNGNPQDQAKSLLNGATAKTAPSLIAEALRKVNYRPDTELAAKITDLITTHGFKDKIHIPADATEKNPKDFLEALRTGKYNDNQTVMKQFVAANKDLGFVATSLDPEKAKAEATKAIRDSGVTPAKPSGIKDLDNAVAELKAASDKLGTAGDDESQVSAGIETVKNAKEKVEKLTKVKSTMGGIVASTIVDKTGKVTHVAAAQLISDNYQKVPGPDQQYAKEFLIDKLKEVVDKSMSDADIGKLADDILTNGNKAKGLLPPPLAKPQKPAIII